MFSGPNIEVAFSFSIISNVAITTHEFVNKMGMKSLNAFFKSKPLGKRFLDWKITLVTLRKRFVKTVV